MGGENGKCGFILTHVQIQMLLPRQNSQGPNSHIQKKKNTLYTNPAVGRDRAVAADI